MVDVVAYSPKKEATCYQCKTKLAYSFSDMTFSFEKDYTGCGERVARITCPVCHARTPVPLHF